MSSIPQAEDVVQDSASTKDALAVQPLEGKGIIPVDGPVLDEATASPSPATSVEDKKRTHEPSPPIVLELEKPPVHEPRHLASPFHTPKESIGSSTTLEDGEAKEDVIQATEDVHDFSPIEDGEIMENGGTFGDTNTSSESDATKTEEHEAAQSENIDSAVGAPENQAFQEKAISEGAVQQAASGQESSQDESLVVPSRTEETRQQTEDVAVTSGEEAEVQEEVIQPKRSVPPHMRSDLQSPAVRQQGPPPSKNPMRGSLGGSRYADFPRAPRFPGPNSGFINYNAGGGREEAARLNAQLMKARNELEQERQKSASMRQSVEEEMQKTADEALAASTLELLNKQIKTLAQQAKVDAKERGLQYREDRIEQLEVFLTEGHKYLWRQRTGEKGLSISAVVAEHESRQSELLAKKDIADREAKFAVRLESLKLREAAQQSREAQYKAVIRSSFEAELRAKSASDMPAMINEVADVEYNRGYGEGKAAGRKETDVESRQKGFFEGYDACHRAQAALQSLRAGRIPRDSPELDFLYDASHPYNFYNVGVRSSVMVSSTPHVVGNGMPQQKAPPVTVKPVEPQVKIEEPLRRLPPPPPPRPTFASELRGNTHQMHNGHYVLANGSSSSSAAPTPKTPGFRGTNDINSKSKVNGADTDLYVGRVVLQYEESEEDNLIDLN